MAPSDSSVSLHILSRAIALSRLRRRPPALASFIGLTMLWG
jgi:hypothetical protein